MLAFTLYYYYALMQQTTVVSQQEPLQFHLFSVQMSSLLKLFQSIIISVLYFLVSLTQSRAYSIYYEEHVMNVLRWILELSVQYHRTICFSFSTSHHFPRPIYTTFVLFLISPITHFSLPSRRVLPHLPRDLTFSSHTLSFSFHASTFFVFSPFSTKLPFLFLTYSHTLASKQATAHTLTPPVPHTCHVTLTHSLTHTRAQKLTLFGTTAPFSTTNIILGH